MGPGLGSEHALGYGELHRIISDSPWAVAIVDRKMRYLLCSERWLEQQNLAQQDLKGQCHYDVFPNTSVSWKERHQRCLDGEVQSFIEETRLVPNGKQEWLQWDLRPWLQVNGDTGGIVLRQQLVTREKRSEFDLKHSNERLKEAQRLAKLGYWEWRLTDNRVTWSPEVYALFGIDPSRTPLTYEDYFAAVVEQDREQVSEWVEAAIRAAQPFYFEHRIVRPDGEQRHVAIDGRIRRGQGGQPDTLVGAAQDVTERRQLEEQLRQVQKMEATGRLAGGIAHDFNNILTAVFSFAEFALDGLSANHTVRSDIEEVLRAAGRAKSLTQQLLAFSRQQTVSPRVVNINERVADIEAMMRRILGEDIAYATHLTGDLWHTRVDPGALEQVIVNLAVNARDAMPSGGRLTLETANVVLGEEETGAKGHRIPSGEYVAFIISDDGEGMNPEVLARIFEPFYTTKGPGHGTGLGLSTCYGIIRQASGYMWVYSEPGRGTTFKVYLPRVLDALELEVERARPVVLGGREFVLIAEDNAQVRKVATRTLRALGYNVAVATSGEDALRVVDESMPQVDLLVTDVVMPGITGKDLADQLSARCPQTKVLFMSGYTENTIVHHGVLEKGIELLQKPFEPRNLGERVRQVLNTSPPWKVQRSQRGPTLPLKN